MITEPESIGPVVKEKDRDMAIVADIVKMVFNKNCKEHNKIIISYKTIMKITWVDRQEHRWFQTVRWWQ